MGRADPTPGPWARGRPAHGLRRQVQPQVESAAQGLTLAANYRLSRIPAIVINRKTVVYGITDVQQALELARRQPGGKP